MTEMIKTLINGRWEIILPKHRAERPEWDIANGGWEEARLNSIYNHLGKGDILAYIGAEEGDMAALCQMWGAKVALFEPNDKVWPNIKAIWEANKLDAPMLCYPGFASNEDKDGHVIIHNGWPIEADGSIISDHGFRELISASGVQQVKLDSIQEHNLDPVTAISIDVEGSEWHVLRGAEQTLRKYHPKIWLSLHPEFMYEKYKEYGADLRQWVKELGYKEILLAYDHEVHLFYEPIEDQT